MRTMKLKAGQLLILVCSAMSLSGCGVSVQDSAAGATGRGTIDFARFACEQNGFTDADFRLIWSWLAAAGSSQARTDLITQVCTVSDTPCLVCMVTIAETFN
jgi:hypothetical protein